MGVMRASYLPLFTLVLIGCGDDGGTKTPDAAPMPDADYRIGEHPQLAQACSDSLADVYTLPTGLPAMDDSHRGDVFRCAIAEKMTVPEIKTRIEEDNALYMNTSTATINSGFWAYRFGYRTQRNTVGTARAEGDVAAVLLIPAKPIDGAPLVVFGHGSVGFAPQCAPSKLDLSAAIQDQDFPPILYRLAGYGYPVIMTDYTGFSYGQPPGYFNAEDEAHAILDATRAGAKLLPSPPTKVAFVGHSQGGHAVISAQSYLDSYGMSGELVGIATLAPFWSSLSLFASATTSLAGLSTTTDVNGILYAMAYAYSAGELREPGTGLSVFQTAKQAAAKDVINGAECYAATKMQALGATPQDIFDTTWVDTVAFACATNPFMAPDCSDPLAAKWKGWWIEDRPPIDATSTAPILLMYGGADTFVTLPRAQCGRNKLAADLAAVSGATTKLEYCYSSKADHRSIVRSTDVDYIVQWIAAKAGIGTAPAACPEFPSVTCATPPHEY
jgi:pimeloyl-ACP methyl ester carboxylesterase